MIPLTHIISSWPDIETGIADADSIVEIRVEAKTSSIASCEHESALIIPPWLLIVEIVIRL